MCMSALSKLSTRRGRHHSAWGGVRNMGAGGPIDSATRGISVTTGIDRLARDVGVDVSSRVTSVRDRRLPSQHPKSRTEYDRGVSKNGLVAGRRCSFTVPDPYAHGTECPLGCRWNLRQG
jgi:hypothetical protein